MIIAKMFQKTKNGKKEQKKVPENYFLGLVKLLLQSMCEVGERKKGRKKEKKEIRNKAEKRT